MNEDKLINAGNGIIYTDDYSEFKKMIIVDESQFNMYEKAYKRYEQFQSSFWIRLKFLFTGV